MATDPLSIVYEALWKLLEGHAPLAALLAPGCRIKYSGKQRQIDKDMLSSADLPEIRVVPIESFPHLQRTSNGSSLRTTFGIEVHTGEQRVDASLFPLEWEIYCALSKWASTLTALKWNDKPFVKLCKPTTIKEELFHPLLRGIAGWSLVWACEVEMWFTTNDLQAEEE